jgi:hypothetical protein
LRAGEHGTRVLLKQCGKQPVCIRGHYTSSDTGRAIDGDTANAINLWFCATRFPRDGSEACWMTGHSAGPRSVSRLTIRRSMAAILLGLIAVIVLPVGTGQLLRHLEIFTQGYPLLALIYRFVYLVLGGYLAARFAPSSPMRHALILGGIWLVVSVFAATILIRMQFLGPPWYYYGLIITALPGAWLGGVLHRVLHQ